MSRIKKEDTINCKPITAGEYSVGNFRIFVEIGEFAGIWIPIRVRIKNCCIKVSAFCNSGFGYIDIQRAKIPLISLPLPLLVLEEIISPSQALEILVRGDDLFELDNIKYAHVSLDIDSRETHWVKAELYGNTRMPGKVIINIPLMKKLGVGFRSEDWEDGLWYFLDKPEEKRKSALGTHFLYEISL